MTEISFNLYFLFDSFDSIQFSNIGKSQCLPNHSYGPINRDTYILHFINSGKGIYQVEDTRYFLREKQFFLIYPDQQIFYQADAKEPWEYYWLAFKGNDIEKILQFLSLSKIFPIGCVENKKDIIFFFNELFYFIDNNEHNPLFIQGKLIELLSLFSQNITESVQQFRYTKTLYSNPFLKKFLSYIQKHYHQSDLSINQVAKELSVHRTYLNRVVKEELGITPGVYLNDFRMSKSFILLESTNFTVSQIATMVGYSNLYSFSRAFSTTKKCSPKEYRKRFYQHNKFNELSQALN